MRSSMLKPNNPSNLLIIASLLVFGFILGRYQEEMVKLIPSAVGNTKYEDKYQTSFEDFNAQHTPRLSNNTTLQERSKHLPGAIIFGAKKCGTGALSMMLNMHPDVRGKKQEGHFFDHDPDGVDDTYPLGVDWYRKQMPKALPNQVIFEKTPRYFVDPIVPARLHAMNSSIKLILIVRDPVSRIVSDWVHTRSRERRMLKSKRIIFENETLTEKGILDERSFIVNPSLYAVHMSRWLQYFKRDQFLVLNGDILIKNPLEIMKQVEKFLNLRPWFQENNFFFGEEKGFFCLRKMEKEWCLASDKGRKKPNLSPRLLSYLRSQMARHNMRFYEMVGINFGWPTS